MSSRDNNVRFAEFIKTIDGDTFEARIELASVVKPRPLLQARIRVANWSAAEMNTVEGRHMRVRFNDLLVATKRIDLHMRTMSFERIVCSVWLDDVLFAGILTQELLTLRRTLAQHPGTPGEVP